MKITKRRPGLQAAGLFVWVALLAASGTVRAEDRQATADAAALLLKTRCDAFDQARQQCVLWGPSLLELITRPEVYDGRRVRVVGFVNFEFEGNALYLSRTDWENGLTRSAVWVDPPTGFESNWGPARGQPNRRYVIVVATFRAGRRGRLGLFSPAMDEITRLDPRSCYRTCPKTPPRGCVTARLTRPS